MEKEHLYYRERVKGCVQRETLVDLLYQFMGAERANGCDQRAENMELLLEKLVDGRMEKEDFAHYKEKRNLGEILGEDLWVLANCPTSNNIFAFGLEEAKVMVGKGENVSEHLLEVVSPNILEGLDQIVTGEMEPFKHILPEADWKEFVEGIQEGIVHILDNIVLE